MIVLNCSNIPCFGFHPSVPGWCLYTWSVRVKIVSHPYPVIKWFVRAWFQLESQWLRRFRFSNTIPTFFTARTAALSAERVDADLYKVTFPFLGGSTVFEETLVKFLEEHPTKTVDHIYTVPKPLRLKKADALIFYIATKEEAMKESRMIQASILLFWTAFLGVECR